MKSIPSNIIREVFREYVKEEVNRYAGAINGHEESVIYGSMLAAQYLADKLGDYDLAKEIAVIRKLATVTHTP